MPLYMFTGKPKGKNKNRQGRGYRWAPRSKADNGIRLTVQLYNLPRTLAAMCDCNGHALVGRIQTPQPFFQVEPPQEFDKPGTELNPDAQVWKTYVRETDQMDGELVDGWNKSIDVILIFAALFSAISTAFVIESYKNLKQDPADLSAQTLLTISRTLETIANGSQTSGSQPSTSSPTEAPPFPATWSAICVNVLWFLSLSLSVAVSLISMLAKEWCLTFMSGRTGPPGAQARRRQQRWDGLVGWRMKEVLMVLPSLIHLSLLLFAIGLCIFLWDVHFGVAIPVLFVTTLAASAYIACTVLPFIDTYCPYGTVISMMIKRLTELQSQANHSSNNWIQDEVTAKALHWMVTNCETPRSVDMALQSLAGATKHLPRDLLVKWDMWTLIKRRLWSNDSSGKDAEVVASREAHTRALQSIIAVREGEEMLQYGLSPEAIKLEILVLGLQSCIDRICDQIKDQNMCDSKTEEILEQCANIGVQLLKANKITPVRLNAERVEEWTDVVDTVTLSGEIVELLENHFKGDTDLQPLVYTALCASLAFLQCSMDTDKPRVVTKLASHFMRLIRAYVPLVTQYKTEYGKASTGSRAETRAYDLWKKTSSQDQELGLLLGLIPKTYAYYENDAQAPTGLPPQTTYMILEQEVELIWRLLVAVVHVDEGIPDTALQRAYGYLHLHSKASDYSLSPEDTALIRDFATQEHVEYSQRGKAYFNDSSLATFFNDLNTHLSVNANVTLAETPLIYVETLFDILRYLSSGGRWVPTAEIYLATVHNLCHATSIEDKQKYYQLMTSFPFPKPSPHLVQLLSRNGLVPALAVAMNNEDAAIRAFATAQLWVFFNMSLQFTDRTSATLTILESALIKYPILDADLSKQGAVAGDLEAQLVSLLAEYGQLAANLAYYHDVSGFIFQRYDYLNRVAECMFQKRGESFSDQDYGQLYYFPKLLRGWESSVYLDGEDKS